MNPTLMPLVLFIQLHVNLFVSEVHVRWQMTTQRAYQNNQKEKCSKSWYIVKMFEDVYVQPLCLFSAIISLI